MNEGNIRVVDIRVMGLAGHMLDEKYKHYEVFRTKFLYKDYLVPIINKDTTKGVDNSEKF